MDLDDEPRRTNKVEWDEAKRWSNLAKHRIDFHAAQDLFDGRPVLTVDSKYAAEVRFLTTGVVKSRIVTVIWTRRGEVIRLISARSARDAERSAYRKRYGI